MTDKILLVTVNKTEATTVLRIFSEATNKPWKRQTIDSKIYYPFGQINGIDIFMVQSEAGTTPVGASYSTVRNAIDSLKPDFIIMVGVAYGLNQKKQKIGEILVSKKLTPYEPGKIFTGDFLPRGDRISPPKILFDKFRSGDNDWKGARVHFGIILSGEKLVADQKFRSWLLDLEPEAIGGEMEGAGLYIASYEENVNWILVKGISDWGDENKNDKDQKLAARNATKFVLHVIQRAVWKEGIHENLVLEKSSQDTNDKQSNQIHLNQIQEPFMHQLEKELIQNMNKYFASSVSDLKKGENYLAILYLSEERREIKRISKELRILHSRKPEYLSDELAYLIKNQIDDTEKHARLTLELINAALSQEYHPLGESIQLASRKLMDYIETVSASMVGSQIDKIWNSLLSLRLEMEIYEACINELNNYLQAIIKK